MQRRDMKTLTLFLTLFSLASPLQAELEYTDSAQWCFNQDCAAWNDTLATTLAYGLQLCDCTDAAAPVFLDDFYTEGDKAWSVAREGSCLALSTWNGPLFILELQVDASLQLDARLSGVPAKSELLLQRRGDSLLAVAAGEGHPSLKVLDLSDPSNPENASSLHLGGVPNGLDLRGDTLFVSARDFGLHAVDLGDPDDPVLLGSLALPGGQQSLSVDGELAVLASGTDGFTVVGIADPAAMVPLATVAPFAGQHENLKVREVILDGSMLHVICEVAGDLVYDLTDPAAPLLVAYDPRLDQVPAIDPYYIFNKGARDGDRLYLAHWSGKLPGCVILDAESSDLALMGRTLAYDYIRDLDAEDGFIYTCAGQSGLLVHEQDEAGMLLPRGQLTIPKTWGVQARDGFVYVTSTRDGLIIGDVSDPDQPLIRATVAVGAARNLALAGDMAYVATFNSGLCAVDIFDPAAPQILGYADREGIESVNVAVLGDLAVSADLYDGMNLWDVSDPSNIQHLGNLATLDRAVDVVLDPSGDYAYLAVNECPALIVDISSPDSPQTLGSFAPGANNLDLEAGMLYASTGGGGVLAYHQSISPENPPLLGSFDTVHSAVAVAGLPAQDGDPRLFVADYSALLALELDNGTPTALIDFRLFADSEGVHLDLVFSERVEEENLRLLVEIDGLETVVPLIGSGQEWLGLDSSSRRGLRSYRLHVRDTMDGNWQLLGFRSLDFQPTATLTRLEVWPNPARESSELRFSLDESADLEISIYDLSGRRLRSLGKGSFSTGEQQIVWNGRGDRGEKLPAGIYLLRLSGRDTQGSSIKATKKLTRLH